MDFGDWFFRWLDLVGECEKARRMIDDDIKVAVMLKRSPKELRDHLVLESPQLANVEFKFPVMRELIQHWCQSRRVFFSQKQPMEVAAVSTAAARDSDVTVSAVGWHGSLPCFEPCLNSFWRILFFLRFPVPLLLPWCSMLVTIGQGN